VLFPFTRLVHIVSAPVWYLGRRYQIVRQKAVRPVAARPPKARQFEEPVREAQGQTAPAFALKAKDA
jgi:nitrate reductase gamma subunit